MILITVPLWNDRGFQVYFMEDSEDFVENLYIFPLELHSVEDAGVNLHV